MMESGQHGFSRDAAHNKPNVSSETEAKVYDQLHGLHDYRSQIGVLLMDIRKLTPEAALEHIHTHPLPTAEEYFAGINTESNKLLADVKRDMTEFPRYVEAFNLLVKQINTASDFESAQKDIQSLKDMLRSQPSQI